MASCQRPPNVVNFFKIMIELNLREEKIRLAKKFTRKYEGGLPNPVLLKVPDGTEWRVNWNKRDGGIWFEKGWKEFVEHYSLAHGHLLMFKYVVASHFEVQIFDLSALEIDYPQRVTNKERARNMEKHNVDAKAEDVPKEEVKSEYDPKEEVKSENDINADPPRQQVQEQEDKSILQRDRIRRPKNHSFKVKIQPSYVRGRCIAIPMSFAKKHLKEGPVHLKVGGRTWTLRYKTWSGISTRKHKLQNGWTKFRRDNHLAVGDVCVFELTNSTRVTTFTILIARAADKPSCSCSPFCNI